MGFAWASRNSTGNQLEVLVAISQGIFPYFLQNVFYELFWKFQSFFSHFIRSSKNNSCIFFSNSFHEDFFPSSSLRKSITYYVKSPLEFHRDRFPHSNFTEDILPKGFTKNSFRNLTSILPRYLLSLFQKKKSSNFFMFYRA